jgi:hypothetical protein
MRRFTFAAALVVSAAIGGAQSPAFRFLEGPIPHAAGSVDAVADLDNDGDFDLVCAGGVFVNDGHARFAPAAGAPLAFARGRTVVADLNGDAARDVVSIAGVYVRIDLNSGGLGFVGPIGGLPPQGGGVFPVNLGTGDADGDGDLDILVGTMKTNAGTPTAAPPALWLNNGTAGFAVAPASMFPSTPQPALAHVSLRDIDLDGDRHAVIAGSDSQAAGVVQVFTNVGTGFTVSQTIAAPGVSAVEIGNFDGDSLPDLAIAGPGMVGIAFNSQLGFAPAVATATPTATAALQAVDLNGDGADELLREAQAPAAGVGVHAVAAGAVLPATQSWPDLGLVGAPGPEAARDLDGDQDADVVASAPAGPLALMSDGVGALVRVGGRLDSVTIGSRMAQGDVDGDGDPDILGLSQPASIATALDDGDGFFTSGPSSALALPGSLVYYTLYAFDRDGDGDSDVYAARNVASVFGGAPADVLYDCSGGTFTAIAGITGTGSASAFEAADFDGDGDADVLLGRRGPVSINNGITSPMALLVNQGAAGLAPPVGIGGNHATYDLEVADFDGDGDLDVFQTNANAGVGPTDDCVLNLNGGSATFTTAPQTGVSGFFSAAGDLNFDGRPDVVIDGYALINNGAGAFTSGVPLTSALVAPAKLADADGDGMLDLIETPATLMRGAGAGAFGPAESYLPRTPVTPASWDRPETFVADVDRDGDPDLVAPGPLVLVNVTRQLALGSIPRPGRPASIDLFGTPGASWLLYASTGPAQFAYPPYGNVLIDPASAQLGAIGTFAPSTAANPGAATLQVICPNLPGLVGWTSYWEAIDGGSLRFTNRVVVTVQGW